MDRPASLEVLLDHAQDKIVLLDGRGRFTYANDAVERILGYDPGDLIGRSAFEYVHPDDVEEVRSAFERTVRRDAFEETTVEYRFRASDGSWVWMESRMSNLTDEELDGYVVSSRDVTDRVEAERERHETATRLRELAATTGDVLWMFDGDWSELLFVNPAYEDLYGMPVEDLAADPRTFLDAIHPDDVPAVRDAMGRVSGGQSANMEYRVNPEADYDTWVWVQAEPIVEDGEVARITGFSRDVTNRRRRERQLYVMDNLLRHNLRNDLNLILGHAEFIEEEVPEVSDRAAVIRRTGRDLLSSAEKEREIIDILTVDPTLTRLDLVDAVEVGVETVRERFPAATIETSCPRAAPVYALEEIPLVLVELLENAIRHGGTDSPSVRVAVRSGDGRVDLVVEDEAPPVPEMEARVLTGDHEMSDVYHSSGLGLWLVYWIVELSAGEISVESREGAGNLIRVSIPRKRD